VVLRRNAPSWRSELSTFVGCRGQEAWTSMCTVWYNSSAGVEGGEDWYRVEALGFFGPRSNRSGHLFRPDCCPDSGKYLANSPPIR
jgi:hypothetical protein